MRLTARIYSTSNKWFPRFPDIGNFDALFDNAGRNRLFKHDRALSALSASMNDKLVTFSNNDTPLVVLTACVICDSLKKWLDKNEIDHNRAKLVSKKLSRNIKRERETFCRLHIDKVHDDKTIKIKIDTTDNDIPQTRRWDRIFAGVLADFVKLIAEDERYNINATIFLDDSVETYSKELSSLRAQLKYEDEIAECNSKRFICPNYNGGRCSPCKFDCPNYKNGNCVEIKEERD